MSTPPNIHISSHMSIHPPNSVHPHTSVCPLKSKHPPYVCTHPDVCMSLCNPGDIWGVHLPVYIRRITRHLPVIFSVFFCIFHASLLMSHIQNPCNVIVFFANCYFVFLYLFTWSHKCSIPPTGLSSCNSMKCNLPNVTSSTTGSQAS